MLHLIVTVLVVVQCCTATARAQYSTQGSSQGAPGKRSCPAPPHNPCFADDHIQLGQLGLLALEMPRLPKQFGHPITLCTGRRKTRSRESAAARLRQPPRPPTPPHPSLHPRSPACASLRGSRGPLPVAATASIPLPPPAYARLRLRPLAPRQAAAGGGGPATAGGGRGR